MIKSERTRYLEKNVQKQVQQQLPNISTNVFKLCYSFSVYPLETMAHRYTYYHIQMHCHFFRFYCCSWALMYSTQIDFFFCFDLGFKTFQNSRIEECLIPDRRIFFYGHHCPTMNLKTERKKTRISEAESNNIHN